MNWKNVKLIFVREIRDQLRDRRTVFMIAVLPVLLYPAMGIGLAYMRTTFQEQQRTVLILGAADLPQFCKDCPPDDRAKIIPLLKGKRFHEEHFQQPDVAATLRVFTDRRGTLAESDVNADVQRLIGQTRKIRSQIARQRGLDPDDSELREVNRELRQQMAVAGIQVLVVIPRGFAKTVASPGKDKSPAAAEIVVLRNSADEKAMIAYRRTREAINKWRDGFGSNPMRVDVVEVAEISQISDTMWSRFLPGLLVIMAVTGAFYPAVDIAAGEKERGTMETLLICPASRSEIVVGKFFTVMAFSMTTALLNLAAMGVTGIVALPLMQRTATAGLSAPSLAAIGWVILLLIPLAAIFSALSLAFATFARSSKEGQYYLTPLLMVTFGLTLYCLTPGHEIDPFNSIIPVMAPTLLLKELLSPAADSSALLYLVPVLVTSFGYSALALWWAIDQFSREDVLFRGAERFSPRLWMKHLLRDKESMPSFAEAGCCFVLIMLLQFGATGWLGMMLAGRPLTVLLIAQQLLTIAAPALLMGWMLTSSLRKTLRLNWPRSRYLFIAIALPLVIHPVLVELSAGMDWFFPKLPPSIAKKLSMMLDPNQPLWIGLLAFALAPAICEEVAFRGFILSGFSRGKRIWLGVLLSSALFGLMHMIPQQVFNTTLLGIVIALLAIRSNSILPGIVFHFTNNALAVAGGRIAAASPELFDDAPVSWFTGISGGQIRFETPAVILGALLAAVMIRTLIPKREDVHSQIEDGAFDRDDNLDSIENRDGQPLEVGAPEESTNRAN